MINLKNLETRLWILKLCQKKWLILIYVHQTSESLNRAVSNSLRWIENGEKHIWENLSLIFNNLVIHLQNFIYFPATEVTNKNFEQNYSMTYSLGILNNIIWWYLWNLKQYNSTIYQSWNFKQYNSMTYHFWNLKQYNSMTYQSWNFKQYNSMTYHFGIWNNIIPRYISLGGLELVYPMTGNTLYLSEGGKWPVSSLMTCSAMVQFC